MLGAGSAHAKEAVQGGYIGADFGIEQDLSGHLPDDFREFNQEFIPIYLAARPDKTKVGAGLACGFLWTVSKGIQAGDLVLSPDGAGHYHVGEVTGGYYYVPGEPLQHRRPVTWRPNMVSRADMSPSLKASTGSIGTVSNISGHSDEVLKLIGEAPQPPPLVAVDKTVEDPYAFALEEHLEQFLVKNWNQTELGKEFSIYQDGDAIGQQFPTDTGPIDILAVSKDQKRLLVVELKRGRASDVVVGQVLRYMGYVQDVLTSPGQIVEGIIVALEDDARLKRALSVVPSVDFYRYEISFKLVKS
ncbi:MAG TPA: endonuclease NucS domain-containing protein [Candidatus Limnocylindria bacterium]|nr:endonuclease NucS domain-containing protein [Candidatus Limnocylindria bacterium]